MESGIETDLYKGENKLKTVDFITSFLLVYGELQK